MTLRTIFSKNNSNIGLEIYDRKWGEPESSVLDSHDYNFATAQYEQADFRAVFIKEFIKNVQKKTGFSIFNCRFEHPRADSIFLNFYVYLLHSKQEDLGTKYRIKDSKNVLVKCFSKTIKKRRLVAVTKKTDIQFIVKSFEKVARGYSLSLTWKYINKPILTKFKEIKHLTFWKCYYVLIDDERFEELIADKIYLSSIKKFLFDATKRWDNDNVWAFNDFQIRIDKYSTYINYGQHYFNSDAMTDCLLI